MICWWIRILFILQLQYASIQLLSSVYNVLTRTIHALKHTHIVMSCFLFPLSSSLHHTNSNHIIFHLPLLHLLPSYFFLSLLPWVWFVFPSSSLCTSSFRLTLDLLFALAQCIFLWIFQMNVHFINVAKIFHFVSLSSIFFAFSFSFSIFFSFKQIIAVENICIEERRAFYEMGNGT